MGTDRNDTISTSVRVPKEAHDKLRIIAALEHRSISAEVRWLIDRRLAEVDLEAAA